MPLSVYPVYPVMASTASAIPRFLLPQSGRIWQRANLGNDIRNSLRYASSATAKDARGKPIVLEKPERFNPPSHGSRLSTKKHSRPQQPQHYGGSLSAEERAAQSKKEYPGLPPPEGTWGHWFMNSRALHLSITMVSLDPMPEHPTGQGHIYIIPSLGGKGPEHQ